MTKKEVFEKRQFLDIQDLMAIFECGENKACQIMRGIKTVSDTLGIKGKCTMTDYDRWYNNN